jgi:hypothetical protein
MARKHFTLLILVVLMIGTSCFAQDLVWCNPTCDSSVGGESAGPTYNQWSTTYSQAAWSGLQALQSSSVGGSIEGSGEDSGGGDSPRAAAAGAQYGNFLGQNGMNSFLYGTTAAVKAWTAGQAAVAFGPGGWFVCLNAST